MNLEIKFRAWNGKRFLNQDEFCMMNGEVFDTDNGLSSAYELEQFTGLHDKNGVEIFKGDVTDRGTIEYGIVGTRENCGNYTLDEEYCGFFVKSSHGYSSPLGTVYREWPVVIGNIHENPELLEP